MDRALAEIGAGRGVRHEDLPAWLEEQGRLESAG
jgi:hypothetical protein